MISLRAFGGLELRAGDDRELHSVLAQPKRQAVLIYLAVAAPRGFHRRETLVGLFWPELDEEHARAALSRAVHYLRRSLGNDVVLSRGHEEIGLDWTRFWCDVAGFEGALDGGQLAEGLALYRGDLLPGFYVDDAAEFDHWLTRERARLRERALQAARLLSEGAAAAGQAANALEWARRAVSISLFDELAAQRLIALLDQAGDRAGALRVFEQLKAQLRDGLETDPAPETTALIDAVRSREGVPFTPRSAAPGVAAPLPSAHTPWLPPPRWIRFAPWAAAALLVASVAFVTGGRRADSMAAETSATVAVVPFVVQGDSAARYLGDGIVSLLAERFNQSGELRALDPRAVLNATRRTEPTLDAVQARTLVAKLRPRFVVAGMVTAARDSITITASLFDSLGTRVRPARATVSGPAHDIQSLVEMVAAQLLLTQPTSAARLTPEPYTRLTPSLDALRHYREGEQAYANGRFNDAMRSYQAAAEGDTTFALAFLWLSRSAHWIGDQATANWAAGRALEFADNLALLNQFRVRAWIAYQRGQAVEAQRLYQAILANDITAIDAWQTIGELRYHFGPLLGWTLPQARAAFEHALALSTRDAGSIIHLARLAAVDDRVAALDSLIDRAEVAGVDDLQRLELAGLRAFIMGDRIQQQRVREAATGLEDDAAFAVAIAIAASAGQHAEARGIVTVLTRPGRSPDIRTVGALLAAELAMAQGQWRLADSVLRSAPELTPARSLEYRAALATVPFHQVPEAELQALRNALAAHTADPLTGPTSGYYARNEIYRPRHLYLLAMLDLKLADAASVAAIIKQLDVVTNDPVIRGYRTDAVNLLRAELLHRRGQPAEALAALAQPHVLPDSVLPGLLAYPSAHERFLRAQLLRESGRHQEALQWYETFPDPAAYDLMYLAAVHFHKAEIYQRLGNTGAARAEYQRVVDMWQHADPHLQPWVQQARSRLVALQ